MARNLHTAHKYQIEHTPTVIYGDKSQEALDLIFSEFEVSTNKDDEYDNEYDLLRSELERLRDKIVNRTEYFQAREEFLNTQLAEMGITLEQFVKALNTLIINSDQTNEFVLLSWY